MPIKSLLLLDNKNESVSGWLKMKVNDNKIEVRIKLSKMTLRVTPLENKFNLIEIDFNQQKITIEKAQQRYFIINEETK